jgi:DNA-directed RNA polymerase specialized sigma24 family protein
MLIALHESKVLDGLVRRLGARWRTLHETDLDYIVGGAVDVFYQTVSGGKDIKNVVAFLWKVCWRRACDLHEARSRESADGLNDVETPAEEVPDDKASATRDKRRRQAVAIARSLLPRLGQQNVQAVMSYVLDAVEAKREDVPNQEIADALGISLVTVKNSLSRAFRRLERIAREEGLARSGLDVTVLGVDTPDGDSIGSTDEGDSD